MADSQRKTANLFDKNANDTDNGYVSNAWLRSNGTETSENGFAISEYISCNVSTQYTLKYRLEGVLNSPSLCFYDVSYNFISGVMYGNSNPITITTPSNAAYMRISYRTVDASDVMLNTGSTALPYAPYWQHSLRKLTTATEAVENPLYSDGTAITAYTLKGNEEHTGTPSPQNPVMPNGVGNKTANLCNGIFIQGSINADTGAEGTSMARVRQYYDVIEGETYSFSSNQYIRTVYGYSGTTPVINIRNYYATQPQVDTFTIPSGVNRLGICLMNSDGTNIVPSDVSMAMLNVGQPMKYEPYGYEIPISSGGVTTNIYLGSTQTVRAIGKRVYDGTENWALHGGLSNVFWIDDYQDGYVNNTVSNFALSSEYVQRAYNAVASLSNGQFVYGTPSGSSTKRILMKNTNCATKEDWIAYLQAQYAAGTPVTIWYVLETPETVAVNEPLMKIGNYADTLSNATSIPTTEGANSITVDTTVQPSEFTATWTGWHDASVKEYDGSDWQ